MEMIACIISGLALLAAGVCLYLTMREKKRSEKRNAAVVACIAAECEAVSKAAAAYTVEVRNAILLEVSERFTTEELEMHNAVDEKITEAITATCGRIEKLEKGIVPDYQEAMAAANAVNDFNKGISAILGYDPAEALQSRREKERTGEAQ